MTSSSAVCKKIDLIFFQEDEMFESDNNFELFCDAVIMNWPHFFILFNNRHN